MIDVEFWLVVCVELLLCVIMFLNVGIFEGWGDFLNGYWCFVFKWFSFGDVGGVL